MKHLLKSWSDQYADRVLRKHSHNDRMPILNHKKCAYLVIRAGRCWYAWKKSHIDLLNDAFIRSHALAEDEVGVVCEFSIGDVYLICGLAREIKAQLGARRIVMFTVPKHAYIPALFPAVDEIVEIPTFIDMHTLGTDQLKLGGVFHGHFAGLEMLRFAGRKGIDFHDCWKALFHLPPDCQAEVASLPDEEQLSQAQSLLLQVNAIPGKTVILCPDTGTTSPQEAAPKHLWENVVEELHQAGFCVLTNAGPKAWKVEGTEFVDIPLPLFRAVALVAGNVVANRSGICDLVASLPIGLVVLYPKIVWYGGSLFDGSGLHKMGLTTTALELEIDLDKIDLLNQKILSYLEKHSVNSIAQG